MKRPPSDIASAINPDSVLIVDEAIAREQGDVRSEEEAALLALVDGKRTVAEILHVSRMSGFVAMRRLRALLERKVIRPGGRMAPAASTPNGGAAKVGRLGLTQDLTSAAKAFAVTAQTRRRTPTVGGGTEAADVKPNPGMTDPPVQGEPRATPLQGSVSLPSVIVAFGPDFLEGRRSPTRKLSSPADPPPVAPPVRTVAALPPEPKPGKSEEMITQSPPAATAVVTHQETSLMPRAASRGRVRRRGTPASDSQIQAQELWLSVTRRDWHTLAVVSTQANGSALTVASALAEAGTLMRGAPVDLFVAEDGELSATGEWNWNGRASRPVSLPTGGLPPSLDKFGRVVALEQLSTNPRGITIAQSAEAVLMVAESGVTELRSARRAVEMIGRDRFIGCVLVNRGG